MEQSSSVEGSIPFELTVQSWDVGWTSTQCLHRQSCVWHILQNSSNQSSRLAIQWMKLEEILNCSHGGFGWKRGVENDVWVFNEHVQRYDVQETTQDEKVTTKCNEWAEFNQRRDQEHKESWVSKTWPYYVLFYPFSPWFIQFCMVWRHAKLL